MYVTLYTRPGCALCTELRQELLALQTEVDFVLDERNIADDPVDLARFVHLIPVLEIDGGPLLYPPHHWDVIDQAVRAASLDRTGRAV